MYSVQCRQVNYVRKDDSCNITLVIYCKLNYLSMSLLITVHTSYIDGEIPPILIMADGLILQSAKNVHLLGYTTVYTVQYIISVKLMFCCCCCFRRMFTSWTVGAAPTRCWSARSWCNSCSSHNNNSTTTPSNTSNIITTRNINNSLCENP